MCVRMCMCVRMFVCVLGCVCELGCEYVCSLLTIWIMFCVSRL